MERIVAQHGNHKTLSPAALAFRLIDREISIDFGLDNEDDFRTIQDTIRKAAPTM